LDLADGSVAFVGGDSRVRAEAVEAGSGDGLSDLIAVACSVGRVAKSVSGTACVGEIVKSVVGVGVEALLLLSHLLSHCICDLALEAGGVVCRLFPNVRLRVSKIF
jgi:hypothetical protein